MNWHAAVFGFLYTLGACALVAGGVLLVHWAGSTFGGLAAVATVVVVLAAAVGVAMGVSER